MAIKNFEQIVQKAKASGQRNRVVIAGADSENILLSFYRGYYTFFRRILNQCYGFW